MMLLGDQAKKIATTIVSGSSSKKEPFVQEMGEGESGEGRPSFEKAMGDSPDAASDADVGLEAATEKMMSALKNDDTLSFRSALRSFIVLANLSDLDAPTEEEG